ncbi:hypothetical protein [Pseudomonas matsuisoli]|uniref:Uncharacterized protein n=1 Tax=Pseudomonas matsuisoli TaxID=1515666 RepID=A0A917PZC5_9PSED|nr:hypothetical protein [Pseudomonas matsuisoli]GGK01630.1 hypothetical protein GCM10009304_29290 [Pseudomonas matsuisoli]
MTTTEQQLIKLMAQNALSIAQLTSVVTSFAFELARSSDPRVSRASAHVLAKLSTVSTEMDRQWITITEISGVPRPFLTKVEEVVLQKRDASASRRETTA